MARTRYEVLPCAVCSLVCEVYEGAWVMTLQAWGQTVCSCYSSEVV